MQRVPEVFIDISNIVIPDIQEHYMVSNYGRIYNKNLNRYGNMTSNSSSKVYKKVTLRLNDGSIYYISMHRIVLGSFFPDLFIKYHHLFINHKNGIKDQNFINPNDYYDGNLEWCTPQYNCQHAYMIGLQKSGEEHSTAKISTEEAIKIAQLLETNNYTIDEIIAIMNKPYISSQIVSSIKTKECWKQITKDMTFIYRQKRFDYFLIHDICRTFEDLEITALSIEEKCILNLQIHNLPCTEEMIRAIRRIYLRINYQDISSQYKFNVQRLSKA